MARPIDTSFHGFCGQSEIVQSLRDHCAGAMANHSRDRLQSLFQAVGISPDRRLHWHSWRHYFILRRLDANESLQSIMQWTGHDSEALVIHYAKAKAKEKEGVARFK